MVNSKRTTKNLSIYFVRQDKKTDKIMRSKMRCTHSLDNFPNFDSYVKYVMRVSSGGKNRVVGYDLMFNKPYTKMQWEKRVILRLFEEDKIIWNRSEVFKGVEDKHDAYLRGEVML
jgi:hypothetical protein